MMENSSGLSSEDIKKKVQLGEYTLFEKPNMRSVVWHRFRGVLNEYGEEIFGVSCCEKCFSCFRYKAIKDGKTRDFGTKNLRDHFLYCGLPRSKGKRSRQKQEQLQQQHQEQHHHQQQRQTSDTSEYHQPSDNVPSFKIHVGSENNNEHSVVIHSSSDVSEQLSEVEMTVECGKETQNMFEVPVCKVESIGRQFLDEIDHHIDNDSRFNSEASSLSKQSRNPSKDQMSENALTIQPPKRKKKPEKLREPSPGIRPICGSSEYFASQPLKILNEDEHDIFGRHVANELRSLPKDSNRRWARFQIQKILYEAHSHND